MKTIKVSPTGETPFEELHDQADVKYPSQDEEEAIPQTDAGVERREVQVVVVTDSSDHCEAREHKHTHTPAVRREFPLSQIMRQTSVLSNFMVEEESMARSALCVIV